MQNSNSFAFQPLSCLIPYQLVSMPDSVAATRDPFPSKTFHSHYKNLVISEIADPHDSNSKIALPFGLHSSNVPRISTTPRIILV